MAEHAAAGHPTTEHAVVSIVDGNALAGLLQDALGPDPTMVRLECAHCSDAYVLAQAVVELEQNSALVRCRSCTHTLFVAQRSHGALVVRTGTVDLTFSR